MRITSFIKQKIKSNKGETLTETLASLLIIVPAMVMLAGAIVTAAHINNEARASKASELPAFILTDENKVDTTKNITGTGDVSFTPVNITWYNESNSIYYYFR